MEYRLALSMDPNQIFISDRSHLNISSTPPTDFVNPGLGQIVRLYDLYVPIHQMKSPFQIDKLQMNK